MSTTHRSAEITNLLEEHILAGDFPSAVYVIGEKQRIVFTDALGHSAVEPYRITNKLDTIYDLASLTKPLVTGLLCARRIELGRVDARQFRLALPARVRSHRQIDDHGT